MAPRPLWKGYLKLSLVSCPIALYPAISAAERISFRQVNKATGNRLRQQLVDSITGESVESHAKGRGYEVDDNQFVLVKDEELETARQEARARPYSTAPANARVEPGEGQSRDLGVAKRTENTTDREPPPTAAQPRPKVENTHTIEIERFVPGVQIDAGYYHTPYYIAPRDEMGLEAFAVIRAAMAAKELVGLGHVVLSNRERPIIVEPMGKGLGGITLHYTHEVRNEVEYFVDIPELILPKEMVGVAERILEAMKADFDPAHLEDRYRTVLVSMLRKKQPAMPKASGAAVPSSENVINLMDVLRRSLVVEQPPVRGSDRKLTRPRAVTSVKSTSTKRSRPRT